MFDKVKQQLEQSFQPVTQLATLNMNTLQELAEKQNALFSTLLSDGVKFVETASQQKDVMSLAEAQKAYVEALSAKVTESAKESYEVITAASEKATEVMKSMSEEMASKMNVAAK